jgi:hypothetical protein
MISSSNTIEWAKVLPTVFAPTNVLSVTTLEFIYHATTSKAFPHGPV